MIVRAAIVAVLVLVLFAVRLAYRRWRSRVQADDRPVPRLPSSVLGEGSPLTWVVFTTPYCATCDPVTQMLADAFPDVPVVKVDVTDWPDLARDFRIARAPTVLLADDSGTVEARLVGPEAVDDYIRQSKVVEEAV